MSSDEGGMLQRGRGRLSTGVRHVTSRHVTSQKSYVRLATHARTCEHSIHHAHQHTVFERMPGGEKDDGECVCVCINYDSRGSQSMILGCIR